MKTLTKTVTGALAAALLTTAVASPAEARDRRYDRYDRRGNGISLGDVVLGTIAVAGAATVIGALSSGNRYNDRRYDDRRYNDRRYGYGDGNDERRSVDACAYEAEREAGRRFGSSARVDINDVDRSRDGIRVQGTVAVQDRYADDGYGRRDRYGRGSERVAFACTARYGEVTGLRLGSSYARGY